MTEKLKMLFWGMLCALGALVLEFLAIIIFTAPTDIFTLTTPATWFMPIGVFIEEFFGLVLMRRLLTDSPDKNNIFLRTLLFGLGFAIPEVLLNVASYPILPGESLLPYLGLILIHMATTGIFGYYFSRKETSLIKLAFFFLLAFSCHLSFNLLVLFSIDYWLIITLPLSTILLCLSALKILTAKDSLPIQKN